MNFFFVLTTLCTSNHHERDLYDFIYYSDRFGSFTVCFTHMNGGLVVLLYFNMFSSPELL